MIDMDTDTEPQPPIDAPTFDELIFENGDDVLYYFSSRTVARIKACYHESVKRSLARE